MNYLSLLDGGVDYRSPDLAGRYNSRKRASITREQERSEKWGHHMQQQHHQQQRIADSTLSLGPNANVTSSSAVARAVMLMHQNAADSLPIGSMSPVAQSTSAGSMLKVGAAFPRH